MISNKEFSKKCESPIMALAKKQRQLTTCETDDMPNRSHEGWSLMSRNLLPFLILLVFVWPRITSGQSSEPQPKPEVKSWDFWLGNWKITGTAKGTPTGPEYPLDWRTRGRWILDGAALEFTSVWKGTGPVVKFVEIMSWDPARRVHTFTGFSTIGESWNGSTDIGPDGFTEDYIVTRNDGQIVQCHNEWTFGKDRLTVTGKSVCQLGKDKWTAFSVKGNKTRTKSQ